MFDKIKNTINHFKGLKKRAYSLSVASNRLISGNWKETEQLKAYTYSTYVYACVKKRAETTAQLLNFKLTKGGKDVETGDNKILKVLAKPNKYQTQSEFFELYQTCKDLTGSVFVYVIKVGQKVEELHVLRPDTMTVVMDKDGSEIIGFKQRQKNGTEKVYQPEEIIFSVYPNPLQKDVIDGLSPLKAGAKSVDTETQLSDYQYNVLKNGGKIEGILSFKTEYLTQEQINEIQENFSKNYAEAKNSGKPLVMYGEGDYKNLGLSPAELSYLESKKATREDILTIYQVPKTILGITDGVQKGNYEEANKIFIKDTIKPLIKNIVEKFNEFLVSNDFELGYIDPVPEDIDLKIKQVDSGTKNFYMTTNEKRVLMGLEPITGADDILIPFSMSGMNDEPDFTVPEEDKSKKKRCC